MRKITKKNPNGGPSILLGFIAARPHKYLFTLYFFFALAAFHGEVV
jgi:hypothetical protein